MKNLLRMTFGLVLLMGIMVGLGAADCKGPIYVQPGEWISLNGTVIPPDTDPVTDVWYTWTIENCSEDSIVFYDVEGEGISQSIIRDAYANFTAPLVPCCSYNVSLTAKFNRTVEFSETNKVTEECIDYDCYLICVNETECPLCNDTFCYEDAPDGTEECPEEMCNENWTENTDTSWYITLYEDFVSTGVNATAYESDSECVDIDWNNWENDTYVVTMKVTGEGEGGPDTLIYMCNSTVSQVETPVADIRRIEGATPP